MQLTPSELTKRLRGGDAEGGYFFCGEEEYLKASAAKTLRREFANAAEMGLSRVKLSGESSPAGEVFASARGEMSALSLAGGKKLVEVHSVAYGKLSDKDRDTLLDLLRAATASDAVLLLYATPSEFDPGTDKRPSALFREICGINGVFVVNFTRVIGASLLKWVRAHFAASDVACDDALARQLVARCSSDMFTLSSEIDKLCGYILSDGRASLDQADIDSVARPTYDDGAFDFSDAILAGDLPRALRILHDRARTDSPEFILGSIADCVRGMTCVAALTASGSSEADAAGLLAMHPFRVRKFAEAARAYPPGALRRALFLCEEADLRIKSTPVDGELTLSLLLTQIAMSRAGA